MSTSAGIVACIAMVLAIIGTVCAQAPAVKLPFGGGPRKLEQIDAPKAIAAPQAAPVKLAMGGAPPPPGIDLAALGVEYVEFNGSWHNIPGNPVDALNNPVLPTGRNLSTDWVRKQFNLPLRAGAKTVVWDFEGPMIAGLQLGVGAAYQRDLNKYASIPALTRNAIPGVVGGVKVWLYAPFGYPNNGGITRESEIARIAAGRALLDVVDGSGMCAYSVYAGAALNGPIDQWWAQHGGTVQQWVRDGCRVFRLANTFCWGPPEPETVVFICGLNFEPAYSILPDAMLIAMCKAAIEGGANRLCYWNPAGNFWGVPFDHPREIAETRRVIRCMRIAAGYEAATPPAPPAPPVPPAPPPAPPTPPPVPDPEPNLERFDGTVQLIKGLNVLLGMDIRSPDAMAIDGPADRVASLILADSKVTARDYVTIFSSADVAMFFRCDLRSEGGGPNNYGIRFWGHKDTEVVNEGQPNETRIQCGNRFVMLGTPTDRLELDNRPGGKAKLRIGNLSRLDDKGTATSADDTPRPLHSMLAMQIRAAGFTVPAQSEIGWCDFYGSMSWIGSGSTSLKWDPSADVCGPCYVHDSSFTLDCADLKENHSIFEVMKAEGWVWERCEFIVPEGCTVFASWADRPECTGHAFKSCRVVTYPRGTPPPKRTAEGLAWRPMSHDHGRGGAAKNGRSFAISPRRKPKRHRRARMSLAHA